MSYYILASTNLALPPNQWTPVATNPYDANSNFIFTNTPAANAPADVFSVATALRDN
jgi:hypothetical protein